MDIATVVGVIAGFALILVSLALGSTGILGFFNLPGVLVVMGGTAAATLIMYPLKTVMGTLKVAMNVVMVRLHSPESTINKLLELSDTVRKKSVLELEKEQFTDKFLGKGIRLCVDGTHSSTIEDILTTELDFIKERHKIGQNVFENMGVLAPAFGMIGTLIGLVQMLQTLSDPGSIGPSMAVALLTTFYGALLANLVFIPVAVKLEQRSKEESLLKEIIIEGVASIARGESPLILRDKLNVYLPPNLRAEGK